MGSSTQQLYLQNEDKIGVFTIKKTKPNCKIWIHIKVTQFKNLV
jgi:hypothetical protein